MGEEAKEVLALAWSLFNRPLWEARREMELFLAGKFNLKSTGEWIQQKDGSKQ